MSMVGKIEEKGLGVVVSITDLTTYRTSPVPVGLGGLEMPIIM